MSVVNQNQSNYCNQSQQEQKTKWTNQKLKQIQVISVAGKRVRASHDWLRKRHELFFNQSESEVEQNQSKHNITFDTYLKNALFKVIHPK